MIETKRIQAIIDVLEHRERMLDARALDNVPSRYSIPALYADFIGQLKGLMEDAPKD